MASQYETSVGAVAPPGTYAIDANKVPHCNFDGVNWLNFDTHAGAPTVDLFLLPVNETITIKNIGNP